MCVPKIGRWAETLRQTLQRVYEPTTRIPVPWLLCGDAALALQGVQIEPESVDFRAISPVATAYFAHFMKPLEGPIGATIVYRRGGNLAPAESWRSNVHQRIVAWSVGGRATWLGRWHVDGLPVQVSYVQTFHPDPVSKAALAPIRRIAFEGMEVAVVPIEFLLAESALKNETQLTHRILHAMRLSGHSAEELQLALSILPQEKASHLLRLLEIGLIAG